MPDLRIITHPWFEKQRHVKLTREDVNKEFILDSGLAKIPGMGEAYTGFLSLEGDFSGFISLEGDFSGSMSLEGNS